jgi:hypothetical protein
MGNILDVLRGLVLNPVLTAFARGLAEAVAFLILYSVADFVLTLPDLNPILLVALPTLVRTGEGVLDKIDTAKQRQRDALRQEAAFAVAVGHDQSPLNPGDVKG